MVPPCMVTAGLFLLISAVLSDVPCGTRGLSVKTNAISPDSTLANQPWKGRNGWHVQPSGTFRATKGVCDVRFKGSWVASKSQLVYIVLQAHNGPAGGPDRGDIWVDGVQTSGQVGAGIDLKVRQEVVKDFRYSLKAQALTTKSTKCHSGWSVNLALGDSETDLVTISDEEGAETCESSGCRSADDTRETSCTAQADGTIIIIKKKPPVRGAKPVKRLRTVFGGRPGKHGKPGKPGGHGKNWPSYPFGHYRRRTRTLRPRGTRLPKKHLVLIIGASVGGVLGLALVIGIVVFCVRKDAAETKKPGASKSRDDDPPGEAGSRGTGL